MWGGPWQPIRREGVCKVPSFGDSLWQLYFRACLRCRKSLAVQNEVVFNSSWYFASKSLLYLKQWALGDEVQNWFEKVASAGMHLQQPAIGHIQRGGSGWNNVRLYLRQRHCSNCTVHVRKMTARSTTVGLGLTFVSVVIWTTAVHFAFLLAMADASEQVQQLYSSLRRLNALKQLINAEQVGLTCTTAFHRYTGTAIL